VTRKITKNEGGEMTRRISLIIGVAALALFIVPAALGEGRLAGSQEPSDFWNYRSNVNVADTSPGIAPQDLATLYAGSDVGTNYAPVRYSNIEDLMMAKNGVVDTALVDALNASGGSTEASTTDSATEIDWRQIGIGLGIGALFVLGLGLVTRVAHVRPFAH
jgi:hypothetical protein